MKTSNPTMSHNACYDNNSHRWLVNVLDVVEIDSSLCGEGVYFGYVSSLSLGTIEVVRIKDGRSFYFTPVHVNEFVRVTRRCRDVVVVPYNFRDGVRHFSVGQSVIDMTFDGVFEWYISKFDLGTFRAFVVREISGRKIGHWADIRHLVDAVSFH